MKDAIESVMVALIILFSGLIGWVAAHTTVATECERLGAFYVNEKTFECKLKGKP